MDGRQPPDVHGRRCRCRCRPPSTGIFGIYRQDFVHVRQYGDLVRVPGAGALEITKAPLGRGIPYWAVQKRGNIHFTSITSKKRINGALHLRDDTVTLGN